MLQYWVWVSLFLTWLFAGTAQVISHHAFLLVIVSSCLNQFGKEWSITSFYCASNKSLLYHLQYRTCWKPAVVSQLQRGSEVHKPCIFSNISGSGLIRHDWSLNHLQEEPVPSHRVLFFRLLDSANKQHARIKSDPWKPHIQELLMWSWVRKAAIHIFGTQIHFRLFTRWDTYWALKSLLFRNMNRRLYISDFTVFCLVVNQKTYRVIPLLQFLLKSATHKYLVCFCLNFSFSLKWYIRLTGIWSGQAQTLTSYN